MLRMAEQQASVCVNAHMCLGPRAMLHSRPHHGYLDHAIQQLSIAEAARTLEHAEQWVPC